MPMPDVRSAISNAAGAGLKAGGTAVDRYWAGHTVRARRFRSPGASERYLEWRFREYPLFREFSGLWGEHDRQVVLDYGCGPGNDLAGFAIYTEASRIIGIDVSQVALDLAAKRLALHAIDQERIELIRAADGDVAIPLTDDSVDHVNCQGVLHHTSDPAAILGELARVLRPRGTATVMVYNRDSVWFHLCTAYERMVVEQAFPELDAEAAFARNTDGPDCPIARCYRSEDFLAICRRAGLEGEFIGGYLSRHELRALKRSWDRAIADDRLAGEHRDFLRALRFDPHGRPLCGDHHAGIGGTYRLREATEGDHRQRGR